MRHYMTPEAINVEATSPISALITSPTDYEHFSTGRQQCFLTTCKFRGEFDRLRSVTMA